MKILQSQRGSVLVFIVFFVAVLLIFAALLPELNAADVRIAANQRSSSEAYYLAAAGIEIAMGLLADDPLYSGNGEIAFAGGDIKLNIEIIDEPGDIRQVKITSTGEIGFTRERILMEYTLLPDLAEGPEGEFYTILYVDPETVKRKRGE
jgi:archaellum component FlaG (FlaF/FlaG flagellin family)